MSASNTTTYLLIHGAWHGGECWQRVVPLLESAGHQVFAPSLTGHGDKAHQLSPEVGLDTHVEDVVRLLTEEDLADVVLVGHSYAGLIISAVANQLPDRIAHLVYLDAMVPKNGESALDIIPITQTMIDQAAQSDAPWRIPPRGEMPPPFGLFGVTDPVDIAWVKSLLTDESVRCFLQPVQLDNAAADTIPRTHIHCNDPNVPENAHRRRPIPPIQPNGTPAQIWELPTGHDSMVTMPAELAELLLKLS